MLECVARVLQWGLAMGLMWGWDNHCGTALEKGIKLYSQQGVQEVLDMFVFLELCDFRYAFGFASLGNIREVFIAAPRCNSIGPKYSV